MLYTMYFDARPHLVFSPYTTQSAGDVDVDESIMLLTQIRVRQWLLQVYRDKLRPCWENTMAWFLHLVGQATATMAEVEPKPVFLVMLRLSISSTRSNHNERHDLPFLLIRASGQVLQTSYPPSVATTNTRPSCKKLIEWTGAGRSVET